jgi:putative aldouronate transport system substrate-binding protein
MLRKIVVRILTPVLAVSLLASGSLAARKNPVKPKKIVAIMDTILLKEWGQDQLIQQYKKQTGIDLQIIQPIHNQYYEKIRLAFAAGEIPDAVEISEQNYVNYALEGAFVNIEPYLRQSAVTKKIDPKVFDAVRVKGKIFGYPTQIGAGPVTYIRQDWLDNLKLTAPRTWDEYYKVLKAFTLNDPDRNGKNDTYGFTGPGSSGDSEIVFADNFYRDFYQNAAPDFIIKKGKWVDGFAQPEMKPALERLRQAYQEKLIDPEIFTNKTSTCREKFASGKTGIFPYWYGLWNVNLEVELQKNLGPKVKLTPLPAIAGSHYSARVPQVIAITTKCKNPAGVFKYFVEYMHDGGPGQMLFIHGVENVHWARKGGALTKLPQLNDPAKTFTKTFLPPETVLTPWNDPFPIDQRIIHSRDMFMKNYRQAELQPMPESRLKINQELYNLKNEVMGKILIGQWTVEQGLTNYKKNAAALGINKVLADMNQK